MNPQEKRKNGVVVSRGIEWTQRTNNPGGGCDQDCMWIMPDGKVAGCYAKEVAEGVARESYPEGFAHHYWHPERILLWKQTAEPYRIFVDSMADMWGRLMPDAHLQAMLDGMRAAPWHAYQSLTKNAPRILQYADQLPESLWVGISSPPDFMWGHQLTRVQQTKKLHRDLSVLEQLTSPIRWMSFEPLSWDVAEIVAAHPGALSWAVIGAATRNAAVYQPDPQHVQNLLDVLDAQGVPVFFKGNLEGCPAATPWREEWPISYVQAGELQLELAL